MWRKIRCDGESWKKFWTKQALEAKTTKLLEDYGWEILESQTKSSLQLNN